MDRSLVLPSGEAGDVAGSEAVHIIIARRRRHLLLLVATFCTLIPLMPSPPANTLHGIIDVSVARQMFRYSPPEVWLDTFRMSQPCFDALCTWLRSNTLLASQRGSLLLEDRVMIFLFIVCHGHTTRMTSLMFRVSCETVNRSFHAVLRALLRLGPYIIRMPGSRQEPHHRLAMDRRLNPLSSGCIGAIDGCHFSVKPSNDGRFRNYEGGFTTNTLGVCDLKGRYIYILAGWEGSAHDQRVFDDAISRDLVIPTGKYLLADAGYQTSHRLITPYRGVRYYLREWATGTKRPTNEREIYNLRHSQVRTIIERVFARHKEQFRILTSVPLYSRGTTVKLIWATAALMNWIIDYGDVEPGYIVSFPEVELHGQMTLSAAEVDTGEDGKYPRLVRNIAEQMWEEYQAYLEGREPDDSDNVDNEDIWSSL